MSHLIASALRRIALAIDGPQTVERHIEVDCREIAKAVLAEMQRGAARHDRRRGGLADQ